MQFPGRFARPVKILIMAAALVLVLPAAKSGAQEGGPDAGGVGAQKTRTIAIFKNSNYTPVRKLVSQITQNWDREYKLIVPNSSPRINTALIKLARTDPDYAAVFITLISKNVPRQKLRQRLRSEIKQEQVLLRAWSNIAATEMAKGAKVDLEKVNSALTETSKKARLISRLGDVLRVMN